MNQLRVGYFNSVMGDFYAAQTKRWYGYKTIRYFNNEVVACKYADQMEDKGYLVIRNV